MIYWQLFISFFQVGLLSVGGGYAAMPLIQSQVVVQHSWLTLSEFTDLITIAEMAPGPIGINSATFVGIRIGGILGALGYEQGIFRIPGNDVPFAMFRPLQPGARKPGYFGLAFE